MSKVLTRVIEISPEEWVVQFAGGLNGWIQLGDTFATEAEARAFEKDQIDSMDFYEGEE
jgi:hypothetical protein